MKEVEFVEKDLVEIIKDNVESWSGLSKDLFWVTIKERKGKFVGIVTRKDGGQIGIKSELTFVGR